ncbi:hypothetical protein EDB85DRAFT_1900966 [Lactarius pseudohatsudake]|nr:hypothetical protein EDB85DRAFT_1900966 [Lactarius pseudohatsudake]
MNSSVARARTCARMSSGTRAPRSTPSPQPDDVNDTDMEWRYDQETTLILHDADDCLYCDQWGRHYFAHVRRTCRSLEEAREARLEDMNGRGELRRELSALRNNVQVLQGVLTRDLAALHSEIQQLKDVIDSLVASQREDAHPTRRRKLVHPPPTRASTPSVEAISPGPSSNMRRDT